MSDFVLARRLHALGRRPRVAGWNDLVDALHAEAPLSRAALLVLCDLECEAETRRLDVVVLLGATGGRIAEARLVRFLEDPAPRVVRATLRALTGCGTSRCLAVLATLETASDPALARHASRAATAVRERVGRVAGAVSEAPLVGEGALSVARRPRGGQVSAAAPAVPPGVGGRS